MTHKAQAHTNEHTHEHEIGKVPHVPDTACQVTNQYQFQEKHQECGKEETNSRPWRNCAGRAKRGGARLPLASQSYPQTDEPSQPPPSAPTQVGTAISPGHSLQPHCYSLMEILVRHN